MPLMEIAMVVDLKKMSLPCFLQLQGVLLVLVLVLPSLSLSLHKTTPTTQLLWVLLFFVKLFHTLQNHYMRISPRFVLQLQSKFFTSLSPWYVVLDDCVCVCFIFSFSCLLLFGLLGC
ncbi:hypothetical protein GLYMA_18G166850v4 [Glycine max]|nr:hypothetical protein GLYMA_18G166850v4 [Glycine max]KAH1154807.1 hypothetical protein GYH30_050204 [Glycine max]